MADSQKYGKKLISKRILVVGGTSGIGYCVVEALLECHASVIVSSSDPKRIESSMASLLKSYPSAKERLSGHPCDLSNPDTLESNIISLFEKCGSLVDHVIYTAGDKLVHAPLQDADFASIQKAGMLRFFAPLLIAKHAARVLAKSPSSSITLTTGSVSERPLPDWVIMNSYATGLHGMTRGLALDLKPIRVNLVSPGAVETPLWDGMDKEAYEEFKKNTEMRTTTGVFAKAEDVAEAYVYLLKDQNVSGSVISTNGGSLLL